MDELFEDLFEEDDPIREVEKENESAERERDEREWDE